MKVLLTFIIEVVLGTKTNYPSIPGKRIQCSVYADTNRRVHALSSHLYRQCLEITLWKYSFSFNF